VILVDTHVVLWLAFAPDKISSNAAAAVADARKNAISLAISDITLWELAMASKKPRIGLNISIESFLQEVEARFLVLPISRRACLRALSLPTMYPRDPADRIIGATALVEGLPLLTSDREIRRSNAVHTIW
jgi:PIN domain nuclease of toxin-antitoxin system